MQERACQVLLVLSQYERYHSLLAKKGSIGRVLGAMKNHMNISRIQEDAMGFILNLSMKGIYIFVLHLVENLF